MINTPYISELIADSRIEEIKDAMLKAELDGMQTFDSSLYKLYKESKISMESALKYADSHNNLRLKLRLESPENFSGEDDLEIKEDEKNMPGFNINK